MKKFLDKILRRKEEVAEEPIEATEGTYDVQVWAALDRPFEDPFTDKWVLLVKVVVEGEVVVTELYFVSFEDAYDYYNTLSKSPVPLIFTVPSGPDVMESEIEWQQKQQ